MRRPRAPTPPGGTAGTSPSRGRPPTRCPASWPRLANSTIAGEGNALTATETVKDRAGNSTSAQSPAVKIDRTAPVTTVTAPPAWNNTDVTLTLTPNDALSGVDKTLFSLDGHPVTGGTSITVTDEGQHTLRFWSTDVAGNVEETREVSFGIDETSPTIGHTQSPAANADGWNSAAVTVTFQCSDALSGVATCTGPQTVSTEGSAQTVTGTVTDNAGNSASDPATVSIDKTKPVITVDQLPEPTSYGWYGDDVTVTFTATDALSGVKTQDHAHTFGEGAAQTFTATATDAAGNSDSVTTPSVSVDTTAPTITGEVLGTPNANGWYDDDVTVHWTCDDNLSGVVSCPANTVVTGEGSALSASASVTDKAGHTATATVGGIKIDRTAPSTSATGVPTGWVAGAVTVGLPATDNLSGVDRTYHAVDGADPVPGSSVSVATEGVHTVSYWSVDAAGNTEAAHSFTVQVDLSAPSITPSQSPDQNAAGWNNTDVVVSFSCEDQAALSGLRSCPDPTTVTTEGQAQKVKGTATDNAGNSTDATATVNIDKTAPSISGSPDRAPNGAGWYRDDVTVTFSANDALSGIASVTDPQVLAEGEDQSAAGTALDNAGNSASATVGDIDVDKTAPDLSAAPTTAPNGNGWYHTDVTLVWHAFDALSGLDGAAPADSVLSTEGTGKTAQASVSDVAGNTTTASSEPVKIDKTAPNTDASAPAGWVNSSVDVTLTPHDALSGVEATYFSVDGGPRQSGTDLTLTDEGTHTVSYFSVDAAGNEEQAQTVTVRIDKTSPTITHQLSPVPNANGWNRSDVTVTFTCDDQAELSGVLSCTTPQTVDTEGRDQLVTGAAEDNAGNTATDPVKVSLDKTKPTITGSRSPDANGYGWNNTDVTVHFDASDSLSGIDHATPDTTIGEGAGQSVTGTATDAAGNSDSATVGGIDVDKTAPTLSGEPTTAANGQGWYRDDVTIAWTAGDALSGLRSTPADSTITAEGSDLTATETVTDKAGNSTTADSSPVDIDRTAPVTGADAPSGWNNTSVTVSLSASDGLSGVAATYHALDGGDPVQGVGLTVSTEGEHTLTFWSVDVAGNVETAHSVTVKIDLTKPGIGHTVTPAPNGAGWNNAPVTVSYQCSDELSGVASCPDPVDVASDGADQPVPGTAVDNAGNARTDDATVSIDTVKPTISATPDRDPNGNGWYAGNVTVSYTCADALSGIASCSAPDTLSEGGGQSATGTATDVAGNSRSDTVSPVNVDKTAPTLSGSATTDPNGAGWYRGDVTVRWTADDSLSGLDGPAPADSVITSEGTGLTASATVHDLAGNATTTTSAGVKIDRTAPATQVSDISEWSRQSVTVTLTAGDNLSGVAATYFRLDDGAPAEGTSVTIDDEGVHSLEVWSVDVAGNVEAHRSLVVRIDKTAPGIGHTQAPDPNVRGWNRTDVTVTFTCTDTGSGIASCSDPVTVSGQGKAQKVPGTATDNAGNTAADEATVSLDKTRPTVTGSLSGSPNAHGWFRSDVTVSFTCADQDELSGVLSCPSSSTLGEGQAQSVSGTATDAADNDSLPATVAGINVDKTDPTLSGSATTAPNANGWYRGDVTVAWVAGDALSGLDGDAPADSVVTGEGESLAATETVHDKAGNSRTATVDHLKIDRHAPATQATAPAEWRKTDVTVTLTAADGLSGVAVTKYAVDGGAPVSGTSVAITAEGTHLVEYWSVDKAGNSETVQSVTVRVDKTLPTITGRTLTSPNANGWYNAPVTVRFECQDALSGIADCQADATLAAQGPNSVTGTAVDNAGNRATATVSGVKVDTVAPSVTIGGVADGATYVLGAVPPVQASASDATSGVAGSATWTRTGGLANGVGTFEVKATATDKAGNTATRTVHYQVVYGYGATLFQQPVNDTAHQTGVSTSVFNAGQAIPMKFQLTNAAGQTVQTVSAPKWLTPVKGSATSAAVNESAYTASATVGGSYTWDGSKYQYNWKTEKSQAGSYWRVGVSLDDGRTYYVNIALR